MFCNGCNSSLWIIILIIILFGCGGNSWGCGNNWNCGNNDNCGCGNAGTGDTCGTYLLHNGRNGF